MKNKIKQVVLLFVAVEFAVFISTLIVGFTNIIKINYFWPPLDTMILVNCVVLVVAALSFFVITPLFIYIIEHTDLLTDK